jgi:hypothetical protein
MADPASKKCLFCFLIWFLGLLPWIVSAETAAEQSNGTIFDLAVLWLGIDSLFFCYLFTQ